MTRRKTLWVGLKIAFLYLFMQVFGSGAPYMNAFAEKVRTYVRDIEFDYMTWTLDAVQIKLIQASLSAVDYLDLDQQRQVVLDYLGLVGRIQTAEAHMADIYANPDVGDPEISSTLVHIQLEEYYKERSQLGPLAESVMQNMVSEVVKELGFTSGGQPLPPILYHSTPLPWDLIVSPREVIRQDASIQLETELNVEQHVAIEEEVDQGLGVSSLVVPIGGIGVYPTMVAQTTDLPWLAEVVGHEWMHNYLTFRPLGMLYAESPELRTMNETAANIAGNEFGHALIAKYFPEYLPPPPPQPPPPSEGDQAPVEEAPPEPPVFDFRAEMHETRVNVDALLAEGKIKEAEDYMEARRQFFWDNGFHIRKLNQAYFAFHGAYADTPLGAAGEDPVGAAVRALWAQSDSLYDFIHTMAWLTSFESLQEVLGD
jgi:hypothetical protein